MCLQAFMRQKQITAEEFFGKAKVNNGKMKLDDFLILIQKINSVVKKEEVRDMFRLIDRNNSGTI